MASALQDQTAYEHRWLIDPESGQVVIWTEDSGVDGRTPVDLDEVDLVPIDPLPSFVWYRDMADFAAGINDESAGRSLVRAIQGKGAFRRFKNRLYEEFPQLRPGTLESSRTKRRAIEWLVDNSLIDQQAAVPALVRHADPDLP